MSKKTRDVPVLSGIRGLAALTVFASHSANIYYQGKWVGTGGGQIGVMLFFMLSGYLMSMLYMDTEASRDHIGRFFVNRFARVYPMFAFAVLGDFFLSHLNTGISTYGVIHLKDVLRNLSLVSGYGPFWTIGPEIIFYIIFAALWLLRSKSRDAYAVAVFALLFVGIWPGNSDRSNSLLILHQRIPYFIVGMLLGMQHERIQSIRMSLSATIKWAITLMMPIVYLACFPLLSAIVHPIPVEMGPNPSFTMWSFPFYLLAMAFLLVGALATSPWLLTNRAALFMGRISFPFYLIHALVLMNTAPHLIGHPLRAIGFSLITTVALSYIFNVAIEMPCRKLIRHWSSYGAFRALAQKAS